MLLTKNWFSVQTAHKKQKSIRKYFPAPFLPLFAKIGDPTATKIHRPWNIFSCPFWAILQNFWLPGNSVPPPAQTATLCTLCTVYTVQYIARTGLQQYSYSSQLQLAGKTKYRQRWVLISDLMHHNCCYSLKSRVHNVNICRYHIFTSFEILRLV